MNRKKKKSHGRDEKSGDTKIKKRNKRDAVSANDVVDNERETMVHVHSEVPDAASRNESPSKSQRSLSGLLRRSEDRSKSADISRVGNSAHAVNDMDAETYNPRTEPRTTLKRMTVREALAYSRARGKSPGRPTEKLEKVVLDNENYKQQENLSASLPHFLDLETDDNGHISDIDWNKLKSSGSTLPRTRRRKPHSEDRRPHNYILDDHSITDISDKSKSFHNLPLDKRKYMIDRSGTHHSENHLAEIHPGPSAHSNSTDVASLPTNSQSEQEAINRQSYAQFLQLRHTLSPFSSSQSIGRSTDSQPDEYRTLLHSLHGPESIPYTPPLTEDGRPVVLPTYEEATSTASFQSWVQNSSVPSEISGVQNEPDRDIISPLAAPQLEQNMHDRKDLHEPTHYNNLPVIQKGVDSNIYLQTDISPQVDNSRLTDVKRKRTSYVSPRRFSRSSRKSNNSNKSNISEDDISLSGKTDTRDDSVAKPNFETTKYKRQFSGSKDRRKKSGSTVSETSNLITDETDNKHKLHNENTQSINVVPHINLNEIPITGQHTKMNSSNGRQSRSDTITRSAADVFMKLLNKSKSQKTEKHDKSTKAVNYLKLVATHSEVNKAELKPVIGEDTSDKSSSSTTVNADIEYHRNNDIIVQDDDHEVEPVSQSTDDVPTERINTSSEVHADIPDEIEVDVGDVNCEIPTDKTIPVDIVIIDDSASCITVLMESDTAYTLEKDVNDRSPLDVDTKEDTISDCLAVAPEQADGKHERKRSSRRRKKENKKSVKEKKVKGILKKPKEEQKLVADSIVKMGRAASLTDICYHTQDPEYEQIQSQKLKRTKTLAPKRSRSKEDVKQVNTKLSELPGHKHHKDSLTRDSLDGKRPESKPKLSLSTIINFKLRLSRMRKAKKAKQAAESGESEEILQADRANDEEQITNVDDKLDTVGYENQINVSLEKLADNNESELVEGDIINQGSIYEKKIHFQPFTGDEIVSDLTEEELIKKRQKNTRLTGRRESKVRQRQKKVISCCKTFVAFLFSHIGLSSLVVAYCILGGFIFKELEGKNELIKKAEIVKIREEYLRRIWDVTFDVQLNKKSREDFNERVNTLLRNFSIRIQKETKESGWDGKDNSDHPEQWTFPSSLLYAITVMTTIARRVDGIANRADPDQTVRMHMLIWIYTVSKVLATTTNTEASRIHPIPSYGHVAPKTTYGRMVTIAYAVFGIPITLLCLTNIGDVMAHGFRMLYGKVCCGLCCILFRPARRKPPDPEKGIPAGDTTDRMLVQEGEKIEETIRVPTSLCLLLMTAYVLLGTLAFSQWEDWDAITGTYFCFITLSTIGFGDVVPGTDTDKWEQNEKLVLCALYLVFGLSLIAMCFNLVQEDVKAKCRWLGMKLGIIDKPVSAV